MINKGVLRRFAIAAAVSGLVHAGLIVYGPRGPEETIPDLPPLEARIVNVTPPADAPPPAPPPPRTAKQHPRSRAHTRIAKAPSPPPIANVPTVASDAPALEVPVADEGANNQETAGSETMASETPVAETPAPAAPEPTIVATAPPSTFSPEPEPLPAFPRSGRITYTLVYGRDQFPVGRTLQSWKIDGNRYELASRSETTGLADVIRSQHRTYFSRGDFTPHGFRPDTFLMSRNRGRGPEEARASFHWSEGTISLGSGGKRHDEPLPPGMQDLVSFMFQLSIDPPGPGRKTVKMTNGSRIETYDIDVLPEEKIETPLGIFRALPITQLRKSGTESVDVWLAVEYRYLPIRMRFYTRDGVAAGEQLVTEIRLSDD